MICENCGSKVVDGGHVCAACGMALGSVSSRPREPAKVIPFRPKRRPADKTPEPKMPGHRPPPRAMWWIILIIAVALIIPYVLPLGH